MTEAASSRTWCALMSCEESCLTIDIDLLCFIQITLNIWDNLWFVMLAVGDWMGEWPYVLGALLSFRMAWFQRADTWIDANRSEGMEIMFHGSLRLHYPAEKQRSGNIDRRLQYHVVSIKLSHLHFRVLNSNNSISLKRLKAAKGKALCLICCLQYTHIQIARNR